MYTLGFIVFDPIYLLLVMLPSLLLAGWAQWRVKSAYAKASQIPVRSGMSGAQVAAEICLRNGLDHIKIEQTEGWLCDHYDPRSKVVRLSPEVYQGRSLAAMGIAAHEVGHALQDAQGYGPLVLRNGMVPMASIGSWLSYIVIIGGFILASSGLVLAGIIIFSALILFQVMNLPCEFNASSRAREQLLDLGIVTQQEDGTVKQVLSAAAMTYVAALVSSLLTLLYYIMIFSSMRR